MLHSNLCWNSHETPGVREFEIFTTWSLIFTSSRTEKQARRTYQTLGAPIWLSLLGQTKVGSWRIANECDIGPESCPSMYYFLDSTGSDHFCPEIRTHLDLRWSGDDKLPHERLSYSKFPIYEDRLRELRAYMDSQQPKGLFALWQDKRNSNAYYTFWGVLIFGSLSVVLAFCSLAVTTAQTWATFHYASPNNN